MIIGSIFGHHSTPAAPAPMVGSVVPVVTDFYSDSLQSQITSTQSTFTLVSGIDAQGRALSGTYGFVIDQGTASQEVVYCLTVTGVNVSSCTRGVDLTYGTTSVTSLEFNHNRGASVQITTAPVLNIIANIFRGLDSIPLPIYYASTVSTSTIASNLSNLVDVQLLNNTLAAGALNSSETVNGIVQLATPLQAASSTSIGSTGARLVIPTSLSTSTPGSNASLVNVMSLNDGKLSPLWINGSGEQYTFASTTLFTSGLLDTASSTFVATTSIAASNAVSDALILNGVKYAFPTSQGSNGTALTNNGSGTLAWTQPLNNQYALASTSVSTAGQNVSLNSTSLHIPSGSLTASSTITIDGDIGCVNAASGPNGCTLNIVDGGGDNFLSQLTNNPSVTCSYPFHAVISATTTTAATTVIEGLSNCGVSNAITDMTLTKTVYGINLATISSFLLNITSGNASGNSGTINNFVIVVRP